MVAEYVIFVTNLVIFRGCLPLLSVFIIILFDYVELRYEWVDKKKLDFFSWNVATFQCCNGNVFWSVGVIS